MKVSLPLSILPSLGFLFFVFLYSTWCPICVSFSSISHFFLSCWSPLYIHGSPVANSAFLCSSRLSFAALLSPHLPILPVSSSFLKSSLGSPLSLDVHLCTWMGVGEGEGGLGKPQMLREPYSNLISHCWGWKDLTQHSVRGDGKKQEERKGKRGWEWEE